MNDLRLILNRAGALLAATKNDELTLADQAGLYAAARFIGQNLHK